MNYGFYRLIWQGTLSFVVLFILSKILGKKQVAQLDFNDYVIGISIGSIAAEMTFDFETPSYYFIVAMVIFAALDYFISIITRKSVFFKKFFKGTPIILIQDGELNYKHLKKSKLDLNDLLSQCRMQGYFDISEIAYCIFETCGEFAILPKSFAREVKAQDLNLPKMTVGLSNDLIVDGKIILAALKKIDKTKQWLTDTCKLNSKKQLRNILLATYNEEQEKITFYFKKPEISNLPSELSIKSKQQKLKTSNSKN